MSDVASAGAAPSAARLRAAAALVFAVHVALIAHFTPFGFLRLPAPLLTSAFAVDAYRVDRALRALQATGGWSIYDPQVLAGQVAGLWEPFGSRLVVLLCAAATRLRVDATRAFDVLSLALHAGIPLSGYVAARAYGGSRRFAVVALATWSALTFFDGLTHYAWFSGRGPFVAACAVAVAEAAFAERALVEERRAWLVGVAVAAGVSVLLHPVPALFVAGAAFVASLRARGASVMRRLAVGLVALTPVLWCSMLALAGGVASSEPLARVFRVGPSSLFWDLVELPGPGYGAAGSARTLLRVLCLGGAAFALWRRGRGLGVVGGFAATATAFAYGGALLPIAWPLDPYFLAIAGAFAASLPAVELAIAISWAELFRRGPAPVRVALLVAAAVAVPRAVRTVLTFTPELLPARIVRGPSDFTVSALSGINEPFPDPLGYDPPTPALAALADYLVSQGAERGRVLTDDAPVAGFLALRTSLGVVGPLGERGSASVSADPTPLLDSHDVTRARTYLARYGIGFVVLAGPPGSFDGPNGALEPPIAVQGYRVRRVVAEPNLVASGVGHVDSASAGSIRVSGAAGPRVTLRYHYDPGLVCRPGCSVEQAAFEGDAAGFISVPSPPTVFEIYALRAGSRPPGGP